VQCDGGPGPAERQPGQDPGHVVEALVDPGGGWQPIDRSWGVIARVVLEVLKLQKELVRGLAGVSQDAKAQITALTIRAFGRDYVVPKEKLAKLAELPSNGIRISYEHGYTVLGGRTIYVQLQMGFTSVTKKEALITLTEDGKIEVSEIQMKKDA